MQSNQAQILLKQLLDCSLAIYQAIQNNDAQEIDNLIEIKNEKIKSLENIRKFINDFEIFNDIVSKIKEQEELNLSLLNEKKDMIMKDYKKSLANTKVLNKYGQVGALSGSIVDVRE